LNVFRDVARGEFPAGADQHIAQPAAFDFFDQPLPTDAQGAPRLALAEQQSAVGDFVEPAFEIGVDGGCGGSHRFASCTSTQINL
jgi:hypothetical protein